MALPALALQLLTIANVTLERQAIFESLTHRTHTDKIYDYVVVGAGTAGSVVASRLSENTKNKVLLIESGGEESVQSDIPALFYLNFMDRTMDGFHYKTEPQNYFHNQRFKLFRNKGLGGCSVHNEMAYIRGNKYIYEEWEQDFGAKGWSYENVTSTYMKFEKQTDPIFLSKYKSYHGSEGPVYVRSPKLSKLESEWFETMKNSGYKIVDDINSPDFGDKNVGFIQQTIHNGRRLSTARAYLEPHRNRENLHIITNSTATKILFENKTHPKRATGIEFFKDGKTFKVEATKEVIISAGAIASPQLLMLSGIGVKSHLESLGIEVIEDLPVGDNFHDAFQTWFNVRSGSFEFNKSLKNLLTVENMYEFYASGTGPLSVMNTHLSSFNTKFNNRTEWPDASIRSSSYWISDGQNLIQDMDIGIQILKPQSRGTIRLKTTNPFDNPLIDPKYGSNPQDIKVMGAALREFHRIASSSPKFKEAANFKSNCKSCAVNQTNECEDYFECLAIEYSYPTLHLAGSCRMGSATDPKAVVDERLKVRGIQNLRVIDASIMPRNTEPGTYAPTVMIGEKGSQMIIEDNKE